MIAIKFVFFFEDQRPSPLPIRLADHERPSPVARSTPESCSVAEREDSEREEERERERETPSGEGWGWSIDEKGGG
jgi:hypothetical protein